MSLSESITTKEIGIPPLVMVLDDDQAVLASLCRALASVARQVHCCTTTEQARELLVEHRIDVAIVDQGLDDVMDGLDFLREMHNDGLPAFRVLFTGQTDLNFVLEAVNKGHLDAFVSKPWDDTNLAALVHNGSATAHLRRRNRELRKMLEDRNRELEQFNEDLEKQVSERTAQLEQTNNQLMTYQTELVALENQAFLTQLVRGLAHEFNNPLAVILGNSELMKRKAKNLLDASMSRKVDQIHEQAEACIALVNRMRHFSAPLTERVEPCQLDDIIAEACERMQGRNDALPPVATHLLHHNVMVAPRALARVLEQVFANAIKAQAHNIVVSSVLEGERVRLEIGNDGATPDETALANAEKPFFSGWGDGSTGVGLSLARSLLGEQAATLSLDVRPGGGAVVTVNLQPVEESGQLIQQTIDRPTKKVAIAPVLVVDDEELVLELITDMIEEHDVPVVTGTTLSDAQRILQGGEIRAMFVDVHLGAHDGLDLLSSVVSERPELHNRCVILTGDPGAKRVTKIADELNCHILGKPFAIADMEKLLRVILA